ncbi:MAG: AsnC family transcriptional regulator [Candidatus Bathyarchaeota archaeon]|nr:AsnC family transcriptional regulator [Candidatus Bathyarchaeota archaeon]
MKAIVDIDDIDAKILQLLIVDARTSLKELAKKCGISSVSVLNRVKRLKKLGVITGATLFSPIEMLGLEIAASIGIEIGPEANIDELIKFFREQTDLMEPSVSVGKFDLTAFVCAENVALLNTQVETIRKQVGVKKVVVTVWAGRPLSNIENLELTPLKDA